jgi:DNA mismatch repair protein MSH6
MLIEGIFNAKAERESELKSISQRLIIRFCEYHPKLQQFVSLIAEPNAWSSSAAASKYFEKPTCRPTILGISCLKGTPSPSGPKEHVAAGQGTFFLTKTI